MKQTCKKRNKTPAKQKNIFLLAGSSISCKNELAAGLFEASVYSGALLLCFCICAEGKVTENSNEACENSKGTY